MKRQFGVTLDPVTEVCHCIGSQAGLRHAAGLLHQPRRRDADDRARLPGRRHAHEVLGGEVHELPLLEENGFFPDLDGIPADIKKRAKLLVINYPNSPTGAVATRDFYKRVIDFAHKHQVVIVQDAAHILLSYQGEPLASCRWTGRRRSASRCIRCRRGST